VHCRNGHEGRHGTFGKLSKEQIEVAAAAQSNTHRHILRILQQAAGQETSEFHRLD
jgi:hypothetical protein